MDGNHGSRDAVGVRSPQSPFHGLGTEIERARVNVHKHRPRAGPDNGAGGCKEGERRDQHRVAGSDAQSQQREKNRVRAGRAPDAVAAVLPPRYGLFQLTYLRAQDKVLPLEHAADRGLQLRADRFVL